MMGSKHLIHLPYMISQSHSHGKKPPVPKGCLAVKVGQGEEQQRFVVPVMYFNHPLFMQLLKEAEKEFGFAQKGTITIPCNIQEFRAVQGMIDQEYGFHHHHHHQLGGCFRIGF
ncbi:auxin-responsive protein SAUR32 [Lactuca sativa]|uniref:auxin-responsive protein SAUR32 n=1 Tax=Lactuca sativa TaxID=4236 RepID=UPI000CD94786|nr:auxin-responsive protein SAUR32 [Lactuca sativa]